MPPLRHPLKSTSQKFIELITFSVSQKVEAPNLFYKYVSHVSPWRWVEELVYLHMESTVKHETLLRKLQRI